MYSKKIEALNYSRRGFYCTACNPGNKKYIGHNIGWYYRWFVVRTIHYELDFCGYLASDVLNYVDHTITNI